MKDATLIYFIDSINISISTYQSILSISNKCICVTVID